MSLYCVVPLLVYEIKVTNKIPKTITDDQRSDKKLLIDLKVIKATKNTREVISSPKIITLMGKEATVEIFKDETSEEAVMSLKVTPNKKI